MRQFVYLLLGAALLTACSTDQPSQPAASPATVAPAAQAPATSAAEAPARAAAPAAPAPVGAPRLSPRIIVPAPSRPTRWVSRREPVATPRSQAEASVAQSSVAASQVVQASPTSQPAGAGAGPEVPASSPEAPAAEALPTNLAQFCGQALPGVQTYELRARRDTVLLGAQGTRLLVPADAFDLPARSGPVRLELREYYTTADIVLAGLGTRAGHDLLETGGMLHLYAAANGQTVHLRTGRRIRVQLPTRQQLPGMRLYEGHSADVAHAPDWHLAGTDPQVAAQVPDVSVTNPLADRVALDEWVKLHPPKSPRWPEFAGGQKYLLKEAARLLPTTRADQAYLRRKRKISKSEQLLLRDLGRANHTAIREAVIFAVQLDSVGRLADVRLASGDSVLASKVEAALRQLPDQRPASFLSTLPRGRRTISPAWGYFSVLYARSGQQLVGFSWLVMDKQLREELAKLAERGRAEFARGFSRANASTPLTLESGLYYELSAWGLGWINCDRLLEPGPRILFTVATPDPGTVVSLVFKGPRSILASSRTEPGAAVFEQVPDGMAATVVALRREKGITYLATSPVSLGEAARPALDFRPVSLEQLRTELAQL